MADVFTIKMNDAEFELGGKKHKICDPPFGPRNALMKKWRDLEKKKVKMEMHAYIAEQHKINIELLRQYLPSLSKKELDEMGSAYVAKLMEVMGDMAGNLFGAVVQKVEKK